MADSKYSPAEATIDGFGFPTLTAASGSFGLATFLDPLAQLKLALDSASLEIRLLTAGQGKLGEALGALTATLLSTRSQPKPSVAPPAPASEPKSKLKAEVQQSAPPELLQPAMAMQTAMVDLNQKVQLSPVQLRTLSEQNLKIASDKRTSASGATGEQLAQVQLAAVDAGLLKGTAPENRANELTNFARDAATMASAFRISVKEAGAALSGLRASGFDRQKSLELGDAANRLGNSVDLKASAVDIVSVVQQGGEAGLAAGIKPEQLAAIAAALLSNGMTKDDAGAALKNLSGLFAKDAAVSSGQPVAPGSESLLQALKNQPVASQGLLAGNDGIGQLLKKPESLQTALAAVSAEAPGSASMVQTAEARGNTSQARWNAQDASTIRLSTAVGNAVAPLADLAMLSVDGVVSGLSYLAESLPKVTAALALLGVAVATPLGGKVVTKLTTVAANSAEALLKPDAALQPSAGPETPGSGKAPRPTLRSRLVTAVARAKTFAGRLGAPLALASAGYDGIKALLAGDYKAAAGAAGSGVGVLAGGYAGAATGALIGSFIPVLGTALGGLIGGVAGSIGGGLGGEWLGEKLVSPADQIKTPDQVNKDLPPAQQNTLTANIYINGQDQASAAQLANLVAQQIAGQFGLLSSTNTLAVRSDAALTDGAM